MFATRSKGHRYERSKDATRQKPPAIDDRGRAMRGRAPAPLPPASFESSGQSEQVETAKEVKEVNIL